MAEHPLRSCFRGLPVPLFVAAAFLLALAFSLVRVPEPTAVPGLANPPGQVDIVRLDDNKADRLLRLEAQLRDPAPLFLPTSWNTAYAVQAERSLQRPGESFDAYPAKLAFSGGESPVILPSAVSLPQPAAAAFELMQSDRPFVGLGSRATEVAALPPRSASVEVREAASGRVVASLQLAPAELNLPSEVLWAPAEFVAQWNPSGLAGAPALVVGSGVEAVDRALVQALVSHWPELERRGRLTSGTYRVLMGP